MNVEISTERRGAVEHSLYYPQALHSLTQNLAHGRLSQVFDTAPRIPFDSRSRMVFFSDCHRGVDNRADAFSQNEGLFTRALDYYYRQGFTYVEVGDGDELWQNRCFSEVRRAHRRTFDLLHRFAQDARLYVVSGNHDIQRNGEGRTEKDGLPVHEGLVLRDQRSRQELFVVHGHQADFLSDYLSVFGRLLVRYVWRWVRLVGLGHPRNWTEMLQRDEEGTAVFDWLQAEKTKVENRITSWVQARCQTVICGHTHRPAWAPPGSPPYFNAGSCVFPGHITGLEMQKGEIRLVKWYASGDGASAQREFLSPGRRLC